MQNFERLPVFAMDGLTGRNGSCHGGLDLKIAIYFLFVRTSGEASCKAIVVIVLSSIS